MEQVNPQDLIKGLTAPTPVNARKSLNKNSILALSAASSENEFEDDVKKLIRRVNAVIEEDQELQKKLEGVLSNYQRQESLTSLMDEVNREEEKLLEVERFFNEKVDKVKEADEEIDHLLADIDQLKKEVYFARSARTASTSYGIQNLIAIVCIIVAVLVLVEIFLHFFGVSDALYERIGFPHSASSPPPFLLHHHRPT